MGNPVFNVGDVIVEVPAFVGQKVTGQEFTIIATYRNANGFWHVAETVDANGLKVQEPLNDGGPYLHRVKEATTGEPVNTTAKLADSDILKQDLEKIEADFRRIFGFIGKFLK